MTLKDYPAEGTTAQSEISFAQLPPMGAELEDGNFAGIITTKTGEHCAVVLLPERHSKLTWKKAMEWAKTQGGVLPCRPVAALLFANVKVKLPEAWHWTSEEYDASYAWHCDFLYGTQDITRKSFEGSAVAVRMIPITD